VEMLAVPEAPEPPVCPICGRGHPLETSCALSTDRPRDAAGLREQRSHELLVGSGVG